MSTRAGMSDWVQRGLAWTGVCLMIAALVWWQLLPRTSRPRGDEADTARGVIGQVIIDPGHGGDDSGTMRAGVSEKDLTLDVAWRLDQLLRAQGVPTKLTRAGDETVSLSSRAAIANQARDGVFVSIHFDEGARAAAAGVQTFYAVRQTPKHPLAAAWLPFFEPVSTDPNNLRSQSLAGFVQEAMVARTQALDRGTRAEQFYVVANVRHPAVLVEGGFLSNDGDMARLTSEEYRQQLALAIGEGIMRYRKTLGSAATTTLAAGGPGS